MLKNTVSDLYEYFTKTCIKVRDLLRNHFKIDKGILMHKVKWALHQSFSSIVENYIKYIKNNYGNIIICTFIFDGYKSLKTKGTERNQHAEKKTLFKVYLISKP